jgi:mannose-1-phosphate guanylyltransferase
VGNWDEIYRLSMKDARNNVISGDVISVNSSNCLVISDGKLIGLAGVNDLIVIDSNDAMLICRRNNSDDVMEIVDFLRRKQINRFL